jgi:RNA polymerase sigma-70 factor (ECF subfamily)
MADSNLRSFDEVDALLARAGDGDAAALNELFETYRDRLCRMVRFRMNRQLLGRVDASDVIQDTYLEAAKRLDQFLTDQPLPFFLWLRHIAGQKLIDVHRRHLGARARDAMREISLYQGAMPEATSASLAAQLLGKLTSPSQAAIRVELKVRLQELLNSMQPMDREVLALRHFEQLNNAEASQVLGLSESAASKRYIRALERLDGILSEIPDFCEDH